MTAAIRSGASGRAGATSEPQYVEGPAADPVTQGLGEHPLVQALVRREKLTRADLGRLEHLQREQNNGESLVLLLSKLGIVAEQEVANTVAEVLGLERAAAAQYGEAPVMDETISPRFMRQYRLLPLACEDAGVTVCMADPFDEFVVESIRMVTGKAVLRVVGTPSELDAAIERLYGEGRSEIGRIQDRDEAPEEVSDSEVEQLKDLASEAPVIRMVNLIIRRAIERAASDIHIEPADGRLRVRFRIDGVLKDAESPAARMGAAVVSRIKIMANLNIAERRLPQDGRIRQRIEGQELDFRVSTIPTMHGESVVLRILNRDAVALDFSALGVSDENIRVLSDAIHRPHGMLLVTGPTGSGKTTTLYAALTALNSDEVKIITVEDPVEYQIDGVNQIQVKPAIGLSFATALRSIVRQDPDVIMVGEMRDLETAKICVQSALTGHTVLSTLHTNDAAGSITRLLEMGVENYLLTSTVNAVVGQRLVRVLCDHCKRAHEPVPELLDVLGLAEGERDGGGLRLFEPQGCAQCNGTGYRGRTVVMEVLPIDDAIRRLILDRADASEIRAVAVRRGMVPMYQDGLRKVRHGITTLEEVLRVTQDA
ncbi:MAG: type II secretion system ATPase GspE [Gammaproteobacteria bacterium]